MAVFDVAWFHKNRSNLVNTAMKVQHAIRDEGKDVIIEKQAKSGARGLMEYLAMANQWNSSGIEIIHVYVTKLSRKDIQEQRRELYKYGVDIPMLSNESDLQKLYDFMDLHCEDEIWIHLDESDYGTGNDQLLEDFFFHYIDKVGVYFIDYSASNEEAIMSTYNNSSRREIIQLEVGPDYKGAGWFLDRNLVKTVDGPFWNIETDSLSRQGSQCINYLLSDKDKIFGLVRLTGKGGGYNQAKQEKSTFRTYFEQKGIDVRFVDENNPFIWGDDPEASWKSYVFDYPTSGRKVLIVINQTCTRSTELSFHKYISFLYDYRSKNTPYNTRLQAYGRVFHYDPVGYEILVMANISVFELAAKRISYDEFTRREEIGISSRVGTYRIEKLYEGEFIAESDPDWSVDNTDENYPVLKSNVGRIVPAGYARAGQNRWLCSNASRWKRPTLEKKRDPLYNIIVQRSPRQATSEMILLDDSQLRNVPEYTDEFVSWLQDARPRCNDGRLVLNVLQNNERVFYHSRPLSPPETTFKIKSERTAWNQIT